MWLRGFSLQRELALYTYHHLDRKFSTYFMDKDINPVFKGAHLVIKSAILATAVWHAV